VVDTKRREQEKPNRIWRLARWVKPNIKGQFEKDRTRNKPAATKGALGGFGRKVEERNRDSRRGKQGGNRRVVTKKKGATQDLSLNGSPSLELGRVREQRGAVEFNTPK